MAPHSEQVSPELVLVSPDLATSARASLPDRPWEGYLLHPPLPTPIGAPGAAKRGLRLAGSSAVPIAGVVAFVSVLVAGSVLPTRDSPTFAPADHSLAVSQRQRPVTVATPRKHIAKRADTRTGTHSGRAGSKSPTQPERATHAIAGARTFRFEIDARRHMIARFDGVFGCAGRLTVRKVGLRYDGTFAITRRFGGRDRVTIWLSGRVDAGYGIRGTFRALHSPCDTGSVAFNAHATRS